MRSFRQWLFEDLGYSLIPPDIPKTQTGVIGNGLNPLTSLSKGLNAADQMGFYSTNGLTNKSNGCPITELPVPRHKKQQKGLGDLGMEIIGKTTFGK